LAFTELVCQYVSLCHVRVLMRAQVKPFKMCYNAPQSTAVGRRMIAHPECGDEPCKQSCRRGKVHGILDVPYGDATRRR
jgi:hypothetical protein